MKLRCIVVAVVLVAATSTFAWAQQSAPQSQGSPASSAASAVPVANQVRVVDTRKFNTDVAELKAQWDTLNAKYLPERDKMQQMQAQITALENELNAQASTLTVAARQEKLARLDDWKREFKRMGEDNEAAFEKDKNQLVVPVFEKIEKFLRTYAPQHGISVVLDIGNSVENGVLVYVDTNADITADLIAEYNRLFPVSAQKPAGAPPRPTGLGPAKPAAPASKKP